MAFVSKVLYLLFYYEKSDVATFEKKTKFYNNFIVEYEFLSDNVWHWHTIFELSISVLKK